MGWLPEVYIRFNRRWLPSDASPILGELPTRREPPDEHVLALYGLDLT